MSPQVSNQNIKYDFEEESIKVTIENISEIFDFSGLPDGRLEIAGFDGKTRLETKLGVMPILSAEKKDGILYLELLNWISEDASYEERFPEWIDAKDYKFPTTEIKPKGKESGLR